MKYSQDVLEEMADQIDLLDYASKSVDFIKHSGNTYYAICPFHSEKTPSLAVNTDENFFHCFGCGRSGNIYKWIMWMDGLNFDQAVQKVANIIGLDAEEYTESESVAFYKLLNKLSTKKETVVNRTILDIDKDYNEKFIDEIPQEWLDEGISADEMKKYEIKIDPISNRIVYPVRDADFRLIGVKGRTRFKNFKELKIMKYMNYHKLGGRLDYFQGMMQAFDSIKETNEAIIVEGIKSVMKLDQFGYHNAVAAETSTLSIYQIELLIRMQVRNIVIAFDKDVEMKKIQECVKLLKKFTNVYVVYDKWGLLQDKDSPCDQGREVWETLYERRFRI